MTNTPPLNAYVRITDERGLPTPEFMQWWQNQRQVNSSIPLLNTAAEVSAVLDKIGAAQGSILYRDAGGWSVLTPGTAGRFLQTAGVGANPVWASAAGSFLALTDTPSTYVGQASKNVSVKSDESGLEFTTAAAASGLTYQQLLDLDTFSVPVSTSFSVNLDRPGASATITNIAAGVKMVSTATLESHRTIRAKTVPANWRGMVFGMRDIISGAAFASMGLVLWRTGAGQFVTVGMGTDSSNVRTTRIITWNSTTGVVGSVLVNTQPIYGDLMFYRVTISPNGTISCWQSPDGISWVIVNSGGVNTALGGAPTHFGLSVARADTVTYHMFLDNDIHP